MVLPKPSDDELKAKILELIPTLNLESMGLKAFIKLLSSHLDDVDLKPRKDFIRETLSEAINAGNESEAESSDDDVVERKASKKGGGLAQKKEISKRLSAFLGQGSMMARTDIVKALWEYIREHDLQNPDNRREILLDDSMQKVFDCDKFTMFTMNKYISAHVHPYKPVDLTPAPKSDHKRKQKKSAKGGVPKKRKAGTQPPYRLSEALQDIVGTDILPRPQVVSKIWMYIKANDLQNPDDKREILCDEKLKLVLKASKISMFKMNKAIGEHFLEKLDKSEYQHDGEGSDSESE